jgi:DUF438 domain-containing protein
MAKRIDLNKSIYELTNEYPELINILGELGFNEITKKLLRNTVGKVMTIPKGAKTKNISMFDIVSVLMANGFELVGEMPSFNSKTTITNPISEEPEDKRKAMIKDYLRRLSSGEDLESVRADFVKNFSNVEASEIMFAEQELLSEGTPLKEVQQLCDVHSALFHGATVEEKIMNAEKEVEASLRRQRVTATLIALPGHPLYTLSKENEALEVLLKEFNLNKDDTLITKLREVSIHYAKKGDLLYPHLKVKYGVSGPSDVMWTVDDEIRDELGRLAKETSHDQVWFSRLEKVLTRAEEMIYKEQNILFPICASNFTKEEWYQIYHDSKDYAGCLDVNREIWQEAEDAYVEKKSYFDGELILAGGHLTLPQLEAMLNTIPLEISFIDADNINRYFNEGPKVFKRATMAIDREVFACHPPKIQGIVRKILDDFRQNKRDKVQVWMEKNERTMLVSYLAVRDKHNHYVGTLELVQDMEEAKAYFQK